MSYTGPTANDFKHYEQRKHVYEKPDAYIGADGAVEREEWLFFDGKIFSSNITFPPGCERLYMEILSNASDNAGNTRRNKLSPGRIEVAMDNETISIKNYGMPIPVEIHPQEGVYVPQMVFGTMLTSSNYEKVRNETGTNGIGAKATNIFSKKFMIVVEDAIRQVRYTQVWLDNMTVMQAPLIEKYSSKISSTTVTYVMDFARFSLPIPSANGGGYPQEAFDLFARHAVDISFTSKVPVVFNGVEHNFSNIRDYARLYFPEAADSGIVYYSWPAEIKVKTRPGGQQISPDGSAPDVELIAMDTPDAGAIIAFANSMMTREGTHVTAALSAIGDVAVTQVNADILKKLIRENKGKELDAKKKRAATVNLKDVRPHISLVLAVRVENPRFTSQTKTNMHSPIVKINISDPSILRPISRWKLIDRLYAALRARESATLSKTDGKLRRHIVLAKGIDANNAGKEKRGQCVLCVTEGNSGAGYANTLMGLAEGKRDNIGILPMKGKTLNVTNANLRKLENNKEINEIKQMLGLCEGTDYSRGENFAKLRYGSLMIMADSDVDGKHIIGLILNYFHCRFPQLLARGFVSYYRTPILRVYRGNVCHKFYTQCEYDNWVRENPDDYQKWAHKYFKGLGTSTDEDIADDYQHQRIVQTLVDEETDEIMKLAFDDKYSNIRKQWITEWVQTLETDTDANSTGQQISTFVRQELILYSLANVQRSIPSFMDGFKESNRKVIHATHLKWNIGGAAKLAELKVAQLGCFVAEKTNYHHGEGILDKVIINMAQNFVGANNIPWFERKGQFGSRLEAGKDAAASRYLNTFPENIVSYILRKEDRPILSFRIDEGETIEPECYYPVIPMILVNGAQGIGTGYSTLIPRHNPLTIIEWLCGRIDGRSSLPEILPWYRGFKGTIRMIKNRLKGSAGSPATITTINAETVTTETRALLEEETMDLPLTIPLGSSDGDEEDSFVENVENVDMDALSDSMSQESAPSSIRALWSMQILGSFHLKDGKIIVTELPLGTTPLAYHKWLETMASEKKIRDYRDACSGNDVHFEITNFQGVTADYRTLRLQRFYGMSNMFCLDLNNRPHRFESAVDILEAFYQERLRLYGVRKEYLLGAIQKEIADLTHRQRLIQAIVDDELVIVRVHQEVIYSKMEAMGIPREIFKDIKALHLTQEEIAKLGEKIDNLRLEHQQLFQILPQEIWKRELHELRDLLLKIPSDIPKVTTTIKKMTKTTAVRKPRAGKK